jgi:LAS superfamily LD-carboxypeptidase LdcB
VTPAELCGTARSHIVELHEPPCALHADVKVPFLALRRAALADGFDVIPVSSFRDFSRQLTIWNAKFSGATPLYDATGRILEAKQLAPAERVAAILHWSALPGASRHHWGTDLDLIDRKAVDADYRVQLTAAEFEPPGPFAPLAEWLDVNAPRFGFFRPFRGIRSGVQAEPWHFSFAPVAELARGELTLSVLREILKEAPLLGREYVWERLDELHERYVASVDLP